jgi:bacteriocin-like protein
MQKLSKNEMKAVIGGGDMGTGGRSTCTVTIEYRHSNSSAFTREVRIGLTSLPELTLSRAVPVPAGTATVDGGVVLSCICS